MSPELHALVGPYVIDALDEHERRLFEEHLDRCASCRDEVAELREVPAHLAATEAVEVSSTLRSSVLEAVDRTRQDRRAGTVPRRGRVAEAALAAAAVVLVVAAVGGAMAWRSADERARRAETALAVYQAPDRSTAGFDGDLGSIEVATSASAGVTVVTGRDVPGLAAGRTYELWFIDDSGPRPAGTFDVDADGTVNHRVDVTAPATVAITEEPAGGSPQPTGPVLATATLEG